ncbi:hypothetical protein FOL47_009152 [Perkinsus chesapeaki]|uniref:Nitronate monooxygenase n=1 Tax=Perkinsus chesapeaki TaxID=330153 RepID=A0A7J6MS83_PERCH|nr:hypothetical protein FOL47_009152 [Perkinsus chesapeaki]
MLSRAAAVTCSRRPMMASMVTRRWKFTPRFERGLNPELTSGDYGDMPKPQPIIDFFTQNRNPWFGFSMFCAFNFFVWVFFGAWQIRPLWESQRKQLAEADRLYGPTKYGVGKNYLSELPGPYQTSVCEMPITTKFTEMFGVEKPIMQGGMHHVGYASMAAAVSNAGGLGTITALTMGSPEGLRAEIRKCKELTDKPFAVNMTILPALVPPNYQAFADVVVEEGIKVVETAGRNPAEFIKFFKSHGVKIIHKCTSIRHAMTAVRAGADMISMDGFEAGGHPGEDDVTNWTLYPLSMRKLPVPFIASGACGTAEHLVAALAMGAQGMNMGTRFMATKEAPIQNGIKEALVSANELNTTLVMRSFRNTERVFKNDTVKKVQGIEKEHPGDIKSILPYIKGDNYRKSFHETGNSTDSVWSCGQIIGLIDEIPTCQELLDGIVSGAEAIIRERLSARVVPASKL